MVLCSLLLVNKFAVNPALGSFNLWREDMHILNYSKKWRVMKVPWDMQERGKSQWILEEVEIMSNWEVREGFQEEEVAFGTFGFVSMAIQVERLDLFPQLRVSEWQSRISGRPHLNQWDPFHLIAPHYEQSTWPFLRHLMPTATMWVALEVCAHTHTRTLSSQIS